jgi:hypothetical protein
MKCTPERGYQEGVGRDEGKWGRATGRRFRHTGEPSVSRMFVKRAPSRI